LDGSVTNSSTSESPDRPLDSILGALRRPVISEFHSDVRSFAMSTSS
jgi:hypothetical protein